MLIKIMLGSTDWTKEGITMTRENIEDSNVVSWFICRFELFIIKKKKTSMQL